jgi:hypothetical protein
VSFLARPTTGVEREWECQTHVRAPPLVVAERGGAYRHCRSALLRFDQLAEERAAGRSFAGFREGAVGFAPTYKFRLGGGTYCGDTLQPLPAEKRRTPAWCDRVLWRGDRLQQLVRLPG